MVGGEYTSTNSATLYEKNVVDNNKCARVINPSRDNDNIGRTICTLEPDDNCDPQLHVYNHNNLNKKRRHESPLILHEN